MDQLLLVFYTFLKLSTKGPFIFFSPLSFNCLFLEKFCRYSQIQQRSNVSGKAFTLSVAIDNQLEGSSRTCYRLLK